MRSQALLALGCAAFVVGCPGAPAAPKPQAQAPRIVAPARVDAGAQARPPPTSSGPRHPEILLQAAELAAPRRELANLVAQRMCEQIMRPDPCWGDEGRALYEWPPGDQPLAPRFEAKQAARGEWEVRAASASWRVAVDVPESADAAWVEKQGERWVIAGVAPGTDVALVVGERTITCFFLLADARAPSDLSLRVSALAPPLRLRDDVPVFDHRHEMRAPRVTQERGRVHLRFDPAGLAYPLLAAIQFDLAVPPPAPPPRAVAWTRALGASPGPRAQLAMAYDSTRRRTVLFGGRHLDDRVWERDASGWRAMSSVGSPWQRLALPAAFDAARGKTVLFGGEDFQGHHTNDTWTWDGARLERALPARSPPARYWASMAYDAARQRVVMVGGTGSEGHADSCTYDCDATWEWDGTDWTRLDPKPAPSPRFGAAMTYDPVRRRVLLFGGASYTGDCKLEGCDDTWEWDGAAWTKRAPRRSPPPRSMAALAWDTARGRAVLFGGGSHDARSTDWAPRGDTWEWDGSDWTKSTTARSPSARTELGMVYDDARRKVVLYGGTTGDTEEWSWDGTTWTPTMQPRATVQTAMAWDPASKRVLLFGGELFDAPTVLSKQTWLWDGARWELGATGGPPARRNHALATDLARGKVVLFGGGCDAGNNVMCGDTWLWDGARWTELHPRVSPSPRQGHAMAYDEKRRRVVLYGGTQNGAFATGTWEWDGANWARFDPAASPGNRQWAQMTYDARRGKVVLYGGGGTSSAACGGECADTWEWDGSTWTKVTDFGNTPARRFASLAFDRTIDRPILFGGTGPGCPHLRCDDVLAWDGAAWTKIDLFPTPGHREQHAMAWDDARGAMVVFGGDAGEELPEDTWVLGAAP